MTLALGLFAQGGGDHAVVLDQQDAHLTFAPMTLAVAWQPDGHLKQMSARLQAGVSFGRHKAGMWFAAECRP